MLGRRSQSKPELNRTGSKSSLLTVNRLLEPKDGYKSPEKRTVQFAGAGPPLLGQVTRSPKGLLPRRRHTIDVRPSDQAAAPALRNSSKQSVPPMEPEDPVSERRKQEPKDKVDVVACQLALKHKLMLHEVKCIIQEFLKAHLDEDGGMPQEEFDKTMARIFDVPAVKPEVSKSAYVAAGVEKQLNELNIDKFLDWYKQNMFTQVNHLTADPAMDRSAAITYEVAARHNVSNIGIDKIKMKFDEYDLDGSGQIDYEEFEKMFCSILHIGNPRDLNQDLLKRFWSQADSDGSGEIDFEEYVDWYVKYFDADADGDPTHRSPIEKFYEGLNPTVQRHNHVETHLH